MPITLPPAPGELANTPVAIAPEAESEATPAASITPIEQPEAAAFAQAGPAVPPADLAPSSGERAATGLSAGTNSAAFAEELIQDVDEEYEATVVISRGRSMTDWSLIDIDGTRFPLATANVLGRKPLSGPEGAQFIALSDPERVLSRTHVLIEVDDNELWITDLKSTNGTELVDDKSRMTLCEALNRYAVTADHISVSLGGRSVTFEGPHQ